MRTQLTIGLIGDYDASILAHQAIPLALQFAAHTLTLDVGFEWVGTDTIHDDTRINSFDGLWCVPGSPYRNMEGALLAIRYARETGTPFLGTCGGFQHALLEYARNVLGWSNAAHAETDAHAQRAVITPLACALVEATQTLSLEPDSRIAHAYGATTTTEAYRCSYGINPTFQDSLIREPLRAAARDAGGEIRAIELVTHPFFVATLFQPERAALEGEPTPLVNAYVRTCATTASNS